MAAQNEFQSKVRMDVSELRKAQQEMQATGKKFAGMAQAGAGAGMALSGLSSALKGSASGMLQVAMGAGMMFKAFVNLSPVLKAATVIMGVAKVAQTLWNKRQEEAAEKAEKTRKVVDALSNKMTKLEQHAQNIKKSSDAFDEMANKADKAAKAINAAAEAQIALNSAISNAKLANLDYQEAKALADPKLTDEQRSAIKMDFAGKRRDETVSAANEDFGARWRLFEQKRSDEQAAFNLSEKGTKESLAGDVAGKQKILSDLIDGFVASFTAQEDFSSVPMSQRWKAKSSREKEIRAEFAADPEASAKKYSGRFRDEGQAAEFRGVLDALKEARESLEKFESGAEDRVRELNSKLQSLASEQIQLIPERNANISRAEAALAQSSGGMAASAEAKRQAEGRKDKEAVDQANKAFEDQQEKEFAANREKRAMDYDAADAAGKRKMIDEDIAALEFDKFAAEQSGRSGDAALIDNQIAKKRKQREEIKDPEPDKPEEAKAAGPGKSGIDDYIYDMAAAGPQGPRMANSAMARAFRSRLSKSGFGELGKSFSKSLMKSNFAPEPGAATPTPGRLEDNPAKLQRETNSTLKRIELKLGMRE